MRCPDGIVYEPEDRTKVLVAFRAEVFRKNPVAGVHAVGGTDVEVAGISNGLSVLRYDPLPQTGQNEVSAVIASRRYMKAPGANESRNRAFKELSPVAVDIINEIIRFKHFPT